MSYVMFIATTVVCTLAVVFVGSWLVRRLNRRQHEDAKKRHQREKPACVQKCQNCKFWNQEAGQHVLRAMPTFNKVIEHVSPNQEFGEKVYDTDTDNDGKPRKYVKEVLPIYPVHEDRWEYMGLCVLDEKNPQLIHRTGKCEDFKARV